MASYVSNSVASSSGGVSKPGGTVQEFSIRVPKNGKKKYQVMRFNANLGVDFAKWKEQKMQVKLERENNMKEFKGIDEEAPKFGAGSEFGRDAKDEARRKKYGIVVKKYKPEDQPWILKQGGKTGKKFKGIREGGVSDNTAYYVFTQAGNGVIEAYPLQEWYKFQPIQRYKALTSEEAEQEFGRRNKIINYFSLMTKKRLRNEDDADLDDPDEVKGKKSGSKKKDKELKISEMDDWIDSEDDLDDSDDDAEKKSDDDEGGGKKKGKGKGAKGKAGPGKKKKKKDSDDEAFEESDDGDEEGRELDYISDSSESASDHEMKANKELKGVAEEDALRKLLNSESEDDEENEENKKDENPSNSEDDEAKKKEGNEKDGGEKSKEDGEGKSNKKVKKLVKKSKKSSEKEGKGGDAKAGNLDKTGGDSGSELSPNSTDTDSDTNVKSNKSNSDSNAKGSKSSKLKESKSGNSRSATPTPQPAEKRKLTASEQAVQAAKKQKMEGSMSSGSSSVYLAGSSDTGVTEDAVRRYLMRKPMTTTELLQKFKTKKTGLSSEQLVNLVAQILKNIDPVKQTIKNKMYLSIKPS